MLLGWLFQFVLFVNYFYVGIDMINEDATKGIIITAVCLAGAIISYKMMLKNVRRLLGI